jgi:hypothetical protein
MPQYQSAYRADFSCETAIVNLIDDLLWSMENKKCTALMALDLSEALDTVDHSVLLSVLRKKFGIDGNVLSWFENYLCLRYCKVNVGREYSDVMEFGFSVPQGSCAGPTLYSAYASTLPESVDKSLIIHGFADDHAIKKALRLDLRRKILLP